MKKLIFLFVVFTTHCFSQECKICPPIIEYILVINDSVTTKFNISREIKKELDEFFASAKENEISLIDYVNFKGIYFNSHNAQFNSLEHTFGFTYIYPDKKTAFISINSDMIPHYLPTFKSTILYHEMFHFLLKETPHSTSIKEPEITRAGYDINIENIIKIWSYSEKKKYFDFIKKKKIAQ